MVPRHIKSAIVAALRDFPVVAILGSRRVGKTTLALDVSSPSWKADYHTLDDFVLLESAVRDPDGFIDGLQTPVILDEVQRAPEVLRSIKRVVDRRRQAGMFLITGSANLLTMKSVSESLAGRVALFELFPFSFSELQGTRPASEAIDGLFSSRTAKEFVESLPARETTVLREDFIGRLLAGGYPEPALMKSPRSRSLWFDSYRQTYLERDLREISSIVKLPDFGRLLIASAAATGNLLNTAALSRDLGIPHNTVRRHLGLLQTTYQVTLLPSYFANIGKRLVKTPKLYFNDTGMAASLVGAGGWSAFERQGRSGAVVETWAAAEFRKACGLCERRTEIFFWRTHAGREVDFVLERGDQLVGVEVKWAKRIRREDLSGLESFRRDLKGGVGLTAILYKGETAFALDDNTVAVPLTLFFGA